MATALQPRPRLEGAARPSGSRPARRRLRRALPLVPIFVLVGLLLYPIAVAVYYSLTSYDLTSAAPTRFIGLANYGYLLRQPETLRAVTVTFTFVALALAIQLPLGFGIAMLLNSERAGVRVLRAIVLTPMMIPLVVAALIWKTMMAPIEGVLNYGLRLAALPGLAWLGDPGSALPSVVLIDTWSHVPFVVLLLLAGLQGLPRDPYEAARVDGASRWRLLRDFTLPLMARYIVLITMFRTIEAFKVFDVIYATTAGGPARATTTMHMAAYLEGFTYGFMGTALAYVVMLALLIGAAAALLVALWRRASRITEA